MEGDSVSFIFLILMVALYLSGISIMFFAKGQGQELLGIGLLAAALFVGVMELQNRLDNRWDSK